MHSCYKISQIRYFGNFWEWNWNIFFNNKFYILTRTFNIP